MNCVICKRGKTRPGKATITLERDHMTLVVKDVPAKVCENCGEEYIEQKTTTRLLKTAQKAACAGVRIEIRNFIAA